MYIAKNKLYDKIDFVKKLFQFGCVDVEMIGEYDDFIDPFIIEDIPTIFTIVSTKTCGPKLVSIKYKVNDSLLNTLSKSGNIYISSGIFGVYDELTNFY